MWHEQMPFVEGSSYVCPQLYALSWRVSLL